MSEENLSGWLIWSIIFLVIAVVSGLFGFGIIPGVSFAIAKWLAILFILLFISSLVTHVIEKADMA